MASLFESIWDNTGGKIFGVTTRDHVSKVVKKPKPKLAPITPKYTPPTAKDADANVKKEGIPIPVGRGISQAIMTGPDGIPFSDSVNLSQQILTGDDRTRRRVGAWF